MKVRTIVVVLALAFFGCASTPLKPVGSASSSKRQSERSRNLPIPLAMRNQVRNSEIIGRQMYILDKVSAIATDVLRANVPAYREKNLAGYLPFQEAGDDLKPMDSYLVTFFTNENPMRIAFEVRVKPEARPELVVCDPPKPAPGSFVHMANARQAAIAALPSHPQPLNPLILPAELQGEKGILVYLLAGTTKANTAVFGRHYRVLVPEQGGTPKYAMPLSKGILEMPTVGSDGGPVEALLVTHLLTDWPLETHVFVSLQTRRRVYVGTAAGIWSVDGDKISLIDDQPPGANQ